MSKVVTVTVIAFAGAVACSSKTGSTTVVDAPNGSGGVDAPTQPIDATPTVDAPPDAPVMVTHDFACSGNTMPVVPDPVTITGSAGSLNTDTSGLISGNFIVPYTGNVDVCSGEPCSDHLLGSATADAGGHFSFSLATGSSALAGYVEIPATGSGSAATLLTLAYVGTPYVKNTAVPPIALVPQEVIALASQGGAACTTGSGNGFVAYKAVDCDGNVITDSANVHGSLSQGSDNHSVGDPPIDLYQTITSALASQGYSSFDSYAAPLEGIFLVCGVPEGETTLGVTYTGSGSDVTFLPVDVLSIGSAATEVAAQPGY